MDTKEFNYLVNLLQDIKDGEIIKSSYFTKIKKLLIQGKINEVYYLVKIIKCKKEIKGTNFLMKSIKTEFECESERFEEEADLELGALWALEEVIQLLTLTTRTEAKKIGGII